MKDFLIGLKEMLLFQSTTNYQRQFEIALGVAGWLNILVIIFSIIHKL